MANSDTFKELRGYLDGQDTFMTGGHQVIKPRRSDRQTPDWAATNKSIQIILLRSFPKLKTHLIQRTRAARWAQVIQLYYRMHLSKRQIAEQLTLNYGTVRTLVRNINRAANGRKANNIANTGRPNGRPKIDPHHRSMNSRHSELLRRHKRRLAPRGTKGQPMSLDEHREKLYYADGRDRPCWYCLGENNKKGGGLDRLDNKTTYTVDNTVPACRGCNVWRGNTHSVQETLDHFKPMRESKVSATRPTALGVQK